VIVVNRNRRLKNLHKALKQYYTSFDVLIPCLYDITLFIFQYKMALFIFFIVVFFSGVKLASFQDRNGTTGHQTLL